MANDSITFFCPACAIKLTVPGNLAGVIGPCPSCRTQIQAPYPAPPAPVYQAPPVAPTAPAHPGYAAPPAYPQEPAGRATPPPPEMPGPPAPREEPAYAATPAKLEHDDAGAERIPVLLRPEPRQLPSRSGHAEVVAKQMPEPTPGGASAKAATYSPVKRPHAKRRFARLLFPLLLVLAAIGIGYGLTKFLKTHGLEPPREAGPSPRIIPEETPAPIVPDVPIIDPAPALPVPAPEQPVIMEPPPELPDGIEPKSPSQSALETLEKFLTAKTLEERLPLIETRTPVEELEKSVLAGPFPEALKVEIYTLESNAVEEVNDFFHNVDFDAGDNRIDPHTILVRTRGRTEPKVVIDPFLDTFGGRLAEYAKAPTDKAGIFQVTISPLASCYDKQVPEREKKLTLKLLPRDNTKEITQAYVSKKSKIGEMLQDGTYSLSYGKAQACTVMLRWNTEDDPQMPYLEAIALKSLDWNP